MDPWIIVAIGIVVAILLALLLRRQLQVWWGDKGVKVGGDGPGGPEMTMKATRGSHIKNSSQQISDGRAVMEAKRDSVIEDAHQRPPGGA